MKKTMFSMLSVASVMLALTACGPKGPTPEEIETKKNDSIAMENKKQDSIKAAAADAAAKAKADSVTAAATKVAAPADKKAVKKATPKPATKPAKPTTEVKPAPAAPATVGNGKPSMNGGTTEGAKGDGKTVGNGKPKM